MEKSDFDPRLLEMTWECSHAILGGLSFGWDCVDKMKKSQKDDAEFVQAQILFVIKDYLDSIKEVIHETPDFTSGCVCGNCDIDYPSCNKCVGA